MQTVTLEFDLSTLLFYAGIVILIAYVGYTLFLIYHWFSYGQSKAVNTLTLIVYLAGSGLCLAGMFAAFAFV